MKFDKKKEIIKDLEYDKIGHTTSITFTLIEPYYYIDPIYSNINNSSISINSNDPAFKSNKRKERIPFYYNIKGKTKYFKFKKI